MSSDHASSASNQHPFGGVGRRDFVKVAAAAAAIPVIATGGAAAAPKRRDPLRIGVIGCGGRGTGAALQALRADKDAVLVAMGDIFQERLDGCLKHLTEELGDAAKTQVRVDPEKRFIGFDAYRKVIDAGVDVVLLTSYPAFRPAHLKAAVEAGKHVFAEKPVAVDGPGVRSVLESAAAAKRKNLSLLVGFCWRHNDGMKAMFEQINGGALGEVLSVHTTYHTTTLSKRPRKPEWSDLEFQMRNWWHFTWISGDHVVEQAVHSIDRLNWAMNDRLPTKVTCLGGRAARSGPEHGNVFDHFAAVYEYEGGLRTFHTCRQQDGTPNDNTDYVYGTKGMAVVNGWNPTYVVKDLSGKETWRYSGPTDRDMYQNEHDAFFAGIRSGKFINDGERSTHSTLTAIMARMAAYTGQAITWQQALESKESLVPETLSFDMKLETPAVAIPGKTKFA